jgi:hypothetical protein
VSSAGNSSVNKLNVISLNARSVKTVNTSVNKLAELHNLVSLYDCDVIAITETWLNSSVLDTELLSTDFVIYRRDRDSNANKKHGGGVLLGIKKNVP